MAKVDVRCPFCEQTSPVKNTVMAKVAISVTVVSHANTDGYSAYNDELQKIKHIVSKLYTQRIERAHLTLRNRLQRLNRKTPGYSKSSETHDRIIGTYIEREYYV
ncbi:IS1 family transposase [Candidatus Symbiopectobacterium sp.]|uniref:IS1 family transposase n=1 Tax=Candidatus Symbiopectobacterium sp. TaxID=2816440 RepID=UPI0025BC6F24|nr:IS1 family transposase [Candidatus Symbiopectobacterium sp.]